MMLQPFNSDDENTAPAYWMLEMNYREMSLAQILARFYTEFDEEEPMSFNPLSLLYNPEKDGKRLFGAFDHTEVLVAIYRKGYYVVMEKHFSHIHGPHATFLYYKSHQVPGVVWLATLQISEVMFYREEAMLAALTQAIVDKAFYQSPKSAEQIVIL